MAIDRQKTNVICHRQSPPVKISCVDRLIGVLSRSLQPHQMETDKPLTRAGYLLAAALIIIPLVDATMSTWPIRFGNEMWRYGAVGTLSSVTLVPLLGLLLTLTIAKFADNRRIRRFVGWICALFAVGIAVLVVMFILDYFQVRATVRPQVQHALSVATTTAIIKHLVSLVILVLLSRAGFAGPKAVVNKRQIRTPEDGSSPLIPMTGTRAAAAE